MRLFLTSKGLITPNLQQAFHNFVGEQNRRLTVAFITNAQTRLHHFWFLSEARQLTQLGYQVQFVNLKDTRHQVVEALENADIIAVWGGNTYRLMHDLERANLTNLLVSRLQQEIPFLGVSAGSIIVGQDLAPAGWSGDMAWLIGKSLRAKGLGLIDHVVYPHITSRRLETLRYQAQQYPFSILKILNDQAIVVVGEDIEIIT